MQRYKNIFKNKRFNVIFCQFFCLYIDYCNVYIHLTAIEAVPGLDLNLIELIILF